MKMLCTTDFERGGKRFFTAGLTYEVLATERYGGYKHLKLNDDDGTEHTLIGDIIQRYFMKEKEKDKKESDLWSYYHGI